MIKGNKVGEGTYGRVYRATSDKDDRKYAVKRNFVEKQIDFAASIRELDLLTKFQEHPYIVKILHMTEGDPFVGRCMSPINNPTSRSANSNKNDFKDDKIHFIFPLADGALDSIIDDRGTPRYGENEIAKYMANILLGIEFMHGHGIIHRDIKPSNILLYKDSLQICDFGLSKPYTKQTRNSPSVVTYCYRPPEILLGYRNYDYKVDIWSAGCIFYELFARKPLISLRKNCEDSIAILDAITRAFPYQLPKDKVENFIGNSTMYEFKPIVKKRRQSWQSQLFKCRKTTPEQDLAIDLLDKMLQFDPQDRITAAEALQHPYFNHLRENINTVRAIFSPNVRPNYSVKIVTGKERKWAFELVKKYFNHRCDYPWYTHQVLFQAIDIFDRYLLFLERNLPPEEENTTQGKYLTKFRSKINFLVCLYLSVKYFIAAKNPVSYPEIASDFFCLEKSLIIAEQFESDLIRGILSYRIYRATIYDIGEKVYNDSDVIRLLRIVENYDQFDDDYTLDEIQTGLESILKEEKERKLKEMEKE